jgi:signal transduction histidine kinase
MKILEYLSKQSRSFLIALGLALIGLAGVVDYVTGPELAFSIFYLIPISLVAWFVGKRAGILMSVAGAASWLVADLLASHPYSYPTVPYWNATVRLGFFLIITFTLSALQATQERQEELGQFIVHDLRSPLSNVMTGLQTLQDIAGETMDATQKSLVEMCMVSCNRMLTLINSLLDLAHLESGQMPLQPSMVSVKELAEQSLQQVSVWARRNRVTLAFEPGANVETVYADPAVTTRVLVNLLSNAIKFSPPESVVTVRTAPFTADMAALSVADRGRGIPKEWGNKVFDKFVQVEARRAGSTVGSGLGLSFCRLAVEAQGGRIWLESEINHGTTITFTLPVSAG